MKHKLETKLENVRKKFEAALPVILFFFVIFYGTVFFFGMQYVLLVPVITVLFKINFRKKMTVQKIAVLITTQFLLAFFAFLATWNLPLCILLNLMVPFLLVFLQTSQFNQLGYFASAMTFTFMQMRSMDWEGFLQQIGVLACGLGLLTLILLANVYRHRVVQDFHVERRSLALLAKAVEQSLDYYGEAETTDGTDRIKELFLIQLALYKEAYQSRSMIYLVTGEGKIKYLFALLFQRAVNYLTDSHQKEVLNEEERGFIKKVSCYMELASNLEIGHEELLQKGQELYALITDENGSAYEFAQNFLRLFLVILENMVRVEEKNLQYDWKKPENLHLIKNIFYRIRMDTFEMRFAMRLSTVLIIGFVYNLQCSDSRGYWLVLNAFFLLRPMYEDSAYRLKSRILGTVLGCVVLSFVIPLAGGTTEHFLLASLMVIGMYMETPGTWTQAFFSTCYALTLTTLAMPHSTAILMRLLYIAAAAILVLVINTFFFPTSMGSQFKYNIQMLFHVQHTYLRMIEKSLVNRLDYGEICDVQIHYHLVHDQIIQYLNKQGDNPDTDYYNKLLNISLHMVSEVDQMLYLVNNKKCIINREQMEEYLHLTAYIINEIQQMLEVKPIKLKKQVEISGYKRTMEDAPQLSAVMERYARLVSRLYIMVCRK